MSEFETAYNVGKYLKQIDETFGNSENKSLSEIIESFRLITEDYHELSNKPRKFTYSSYKFHECTKSEQEQFESEQLELINTLVIDKIYKKTGIVQTWKYIYDLLYNPDYAKTKKEERKVLYPTAGVNRPIGDIAYSLWNGVQIIDLDIKNAVLATGIKDILFDELKKYNWFLGICRSASGKGVHVWTKIEPISIDQKNRKVEYLCNFRHKYSYVYIALSKYADKLGFSKEDIRGYLDMAMAKPQQGSFIASDNAYLNMNFIDARLDVNFEPAFDNGIESVNWIGHPDLKDIFSRLEWFNNDEFKKDVNVEITNLDNIEERDMSKSRGPKHYKHAQRWQLANTLTKLFGEQKAIEIMCEICKGTPTKELRGDCHTAAIHDKDLSVWAVQELNARHGFNIEMKGEDEEFNEKIKKIDEEIKASASVSDDPCRVFSDKTTTVELHLNSDQYLAHIKDDIMANLSHITLLEAGAGYGKTEMIKAFKAKTLLILPFTSTIKAKVESSETTKDWLYYYGNKRPTLEELLGPCSMSMTIDKFSHLNVMELDTANFEYIVIDESHLLFTSSYRDVMAPCIQRLANCKANVIMMTGTPTGEMLFFPNITHIKVRKDDSRIKKCEIHMVPQYEEQINDMCNAMAKDIMDGKKIIYPTNNGNLYYEQITGLIQRNLDNMKFGRQLRHFYYKKSNYGDDDMEYVNRKGTVGDNDILFCTTYLSVGVDINDRTTFSVYFTDMWIPQDIEQFANRLRNNNLYLKIFLPKKQNGITIKYDYTEPLDLNFDKAEIVLARDIIKTCNDVLERNNEESKYNPLIQSLIAANRYLKYDENDCKYYIDETAYKLKMFEDRYSTFASQLTPLKKGLMYYGYEIETIMSNAEMSSERRASFHEYMKACRRIRYNEKTIQTEKFLNHLDDNNIDFYAEFMRGNLDIFKSDKYKEERADNNIYAEDIETLERDVPIVWSLYKYYDCDTIRDIYRFCKDITQNKINYAKLGRIRKFVGIEASIRKSRLDFPMYYFVKKAQKWAEEHPVVTQMDILKWCAEFACKYANSIPNLVVQDNKYLEKMFELSRNLFDVVISKSRPSGGEIRISPLVLTWQRKDLLEDIYNKTSTDEFFLQELRDEMKPLSGADESEEEVIPEFEKTSKVSLEQIIDELPGIIHKEFDYNEYSELDGSNARFMRKQEANDKSRQFIMSTTEAPTDEPTTTEVNLFSIEGNAAEQTELPF